MTLRCKSTNPLAGGGGHAMSISRILDNPPWTTPNAMDTMTDGKPRPSRIATNRTSEYLSRQVHQKQNWLMPSGQINEDRTGKVAAATGRTRNRSLPLAVDKIEKDWPTPSVSGREPGREPTGRQARADSHRRRARAGLGDSAGARRLAGRREARRSLRQHAGEQRREPEPDGRGHAGLANANRVRHPGRYGHADHQNRHGQADAQPGLPRQLPHEPEGRGAHARRAEAVADSVVWQLPHAGRRTRRRSRPRQPGQSWPTPNTMDTIQPKRNLSEMEPKGHWGADMNTGKLSEAVVQPKNWPTPTDDDANNATRDSGVYKSLTHNVQQWPTPAAGSPNCNRGTGQDPERRREQGHQVMLQDAVTAHEVPRCEKCFFLGCPCAGPGVCECECHKTPNWATPRFEDSQCAGTRHSRDETNDTLYSQTRAWASPRERDHHPSHKEGYEGDFRTDLGSQVRDDAEQWTTPMARTQSPAAARRRGKKAARRCCTSRPRTGARRARTNGREPGRRAASRSSTDSTRDTSTRRSRRRSRAVSQSREALAEPGVGGVADELAVRPVPEGDALLVREWEPGAEGRGLPNLWQAVGVALGLDQRAALPGPERGALPGMARRTGHVSVPVRAATHPAARLDARTGPGG